MNAGSGYKLLVPHAVGSPDSLRDTVERDVGIQSRSMKSLICMALATYGYRLAGPGAEVP